MSPCAWGAHVIAHLFWLSVSMPLFPHVQPSLVHLPRDVFRLQQGGVVRGAGGAGQEQRAGAAGGWGGTACTACTVSSP